MRNGTNKAFENFELFVGPEAFEHQDQQFTSCNEWYILLMSQFTKAQGSVIHPVCFLATISSTTKKNRNVSYSQLLHQQEVQNWKMDIKIYVKQLLPGKVITVEHTSLLPS